MKVELDVDLLIEIYWILGTSKELAVQVIAEKVKREIIFAVGEDPSKYEQVS